MGNKGDIAKCRDCGNRRLVLKREWLRAARPRCTACGGPLENSYAARKQNLLKDGEKLIQGEKVWNDRELE